MPRGLNKSGNYSNGFVINDTTALVYGTPVNLVTKDFGNKVPTHFGSDIHTAPSPTNFGNDVTDTSTVPTAVPTPGAYSTGGKGLQIFFVLSPQPDNGADYVLYTTNGSVPDPASLNTFQASQVAPGVFQGPVILGSVTVKYVPFLQSNGQVVSHSAFYTVT